MRLLAEIEAEFWKFIDRVGQALDEKRTGFSEYEAGDFLTAQGRMECDGPDAAQLLAEAEAENEVFEPIGEHPDIDPQAVIGKRRGWSGIGTPREHLNAARHAAPCTTSELLTEAADWIEGVTIQTASTTLASPTPQAWDISLALVADLRDRAAQFKARHD